MKHSFSRAIATSALVALAAPAFADVTAPQVWDRMKSLYGDLGQALTAEEQTYADGVLTVKGLQYNVTTQDVKVTSNFPDMTLTERSDGSVSVVMPDSFLMNMQIVEPQFGEEIDMAIQFESDGLETIVSGTDTEQRYSYDSGAAKITLNSVMVEGDKLPVSGTVSMSKISGAYDLVFGDRMLLDATMDLGDMTFEMDVQDDLSDGKFTMSGMLTNVVSTADYDVSAMAGLVDFEAMFLEPFKMAGNFGQSGGTYAFSFTEFGSTTEGQGSSNGGTFDFAMTNEMIDYGITSAGSNFVMRSDDLPLPEVAISLGEAAFNLMMPIKESEEPADYRLLNRWTDLTVSDDIWNLFDPAAVLPRDPATLIMDVSGKARLFFNLMNPEEANNPPMVPGEVNSVNFDELRLAIAGAELTGDGAFELDNTMPSPFGEGPAADGKLNLKLVGANGLMDKLVQLGFLPQDQAMGARMMMGMVARPGEGEDTLLSEIEITKEGGITANGMRLQ